MWGRGGGLGFAAFFKTHIEHAYPYCSFRRVVCGAKDVLLVHLEGSAPTPCMCCVQDTLVHLQALLSQGLFPGLGPANVAAVRRELLQSAVAVAGDVGYEDLVSEQVGHGLMAAWPR